MVGGRVLLAGVALASLATAHRARCQTVIGEVVDVHDLSPITGAFVVLVDVQGMEVDRYLTTGQGTYRLQARDAGLHRLRVRRIGFDDTETDFFQVPAQGRVTRRVEVDPRPVELAALQVDGGEARCGTPTDEANELERVWDEAEKALEATAWTERHADYVFDVARVQEERDPHGESVEVIGYERTRTAGRHPFLAVSPDALAETGWVFESDRGFQYFGPDASTLLHDSFLDTHCFHLVKSDGAGRPLVGLAFEPIPRRDVPEISGVMWLDRETAEMRSVWFQYEHLPLPVKSKRLGGDIVFDQLPGGGWIVRSWEIRTPFVKVIPASLDRSRRVELTGMYAEDWYVLAIWEWKHRGPSDAALVRYPMPDIVAKLEEEKK